MTSITVVEGDYGYKLEIQIVEADGVTPVDLSTAESVYFRAQYKDETTLQFDRICVIYDAANGIVHFTVREGDFDKVGELIAEVRINFFDKVITAPGIIIRVRPRLTV